MTVQYIFRPPRSEAPHEPQRHDEIVPSRIREFGQHDESKILQIHCRCEGEVPVSVSGSRDADNGVVTAVVTPDFPDGMLAGLIIGFVSRIGFMLVYLPLRRSPGIAFVTVALIIAAGTLGFCLFWGLPFPLPGIPVILVSELLGLGATAVLFHTYSTLNRQLEGKIKKLTDNEE